MSELGSLSVKVWQEAKFIEELPNQRFTCC